MRLTEKDKNGNYYTTGKNIEKVYPKFGQLEDIEEEIGVDLNIWANSVYHGIYVKGKEPEWGGIGTKKDIVHYSVVRFTEHTLIVRWASDCDSHIIDEPMKKYGKLWALTKEELQ
jgi:hypothetical protein